MINRVKDLFENNFLLIFITIIASFLGVLLSLLLLFSDQNEILDQLEDNVLLFVIILASYKFIAYIIFPIPGGWLTALSVPIIGWYYVALADYIGEVAGAYVAFSLSKRFGRQFLEKFINVNTIEKWIDNATNNGSLINLIVWRIVLWPVPDFFTYIVGLTSVPKTRFMIATILGNAVTSITVFLLLDLGYQINIVGFIAVSIALVISGFIIQRITKFA